MSRAEAAYNLRRQIEASPDGTLEVGVPELCQRLQAPPGELDGVLKWEGIEYEAVTVCLWRLRLEEKT